jgi:hypothetical protein
MRVAGVAAAALCAFWLVGLTVGMAGFSGFSSIGLHALARAGLKRPAATLRADAIADRSALGVRGVAAARSRGRVATGELRLRHSSCALSPVVLSGGHLRSDERRRLSPPVDPRASGRHQFAGRSACPGLARPARPADSVRA